MAMLLLADLEWSMWYPCSEQKQFSGEAQRPQLGSPGEGACSSGGGEKAAKAGSGDDEGEGESW